MSATLVRIGEAWFTAAPGGDAAEGTQGLSFTQRSEMEMLSGPDFGAQVPRDLRQRGVTASWAMTRTFDTVTGMATWLAGLLALAPAISYQADVVFRFPHEDEGWTEKVLPWGAVRVTSISHDGPTSLRLLCQVMAAEIEDHALRCRALIVTEDGRPIVTEDGRPMVAESFTTVEAD